jgi:hypothetical protein
LPHWRWRWRSCSGGDAPYAPSELRANAHQVSAIHGPAGAQR